MSCQSRIAHLKFGLVLFLTLLRFNHSSCQRRKLNSFLHGLPHRCLVLGTYIHRFTRRISFKKKKKRFRSIQILVYL